MIVPIGLIILVLLASCSEEPLGPTLPAPPPQEPQGSSLGLQDSMLVVLNQRRQAGGTCVAPDGSTEYFTSLVSLKRSDLLDQAALRIARDQAAFVPELSHTGSDGSTLRDRVNDTGYTWLSIGENLAGHTGPGPTAAGSLDQWIRSYGHCINLHGDWEEVGLAHHLDATTGWHHYAQVFATPY